MNTPTNNNASFRFTTLVTLFCVILIISNIASTKIVQIGGPLFDFGSLLPGFTSIFGSDGFIFDGGTLLFPISYIFGDIFAEVYGGKTSRKIIWLGLACIILNAFILWTVQVMPAAGIWGNQGSYEAILGLVPRITLGSIFGYLCGSFANTGSLLMIRHFTGEKWLWMRTIGSTIIGQTCDSVIFAMIAFWGVMSGVDMFHIIVANICLKVAIEICFTPITYRIIRVLKRENC